MIYTVPEFQPYQCFQSLSVCKIATLNFSIGFNILAPYMDTYIDLYISVMVNSRSIHKNLDEHFNRF